jgi:hypothetical protein
MTDFEYLCLPGCLAVLTVQQLDVVVADLVDLGRVGLAWMVGTGLRCLESETLRLTSSR